MTESSIAFNRKVWTPQYAMTNEKYELFSISTKAA